MNKLNFQILSKHIPRSFIVVAMMLMTGVVSGQVTNTGPATVILQLPEYAILKKLYSAYLGQTPRSEIIGILTRDSGQPVFDKCASAWWLKFLTTLKWTEYRPRGSQRNPNQSELLGIVHLPVGDYRISAVFINENTTGLQCDGIWMSSVVAYEQFWLWGESCDQLLERCHIEYKKLRDLATSIAGETSDYAKLSVNLAKFRDLAAKLHLLESKEAQLFLEKADGLVGFGAGWDQSVNNATQTTIKDKFSSELVATLALEIQKQGVNFAAETKASIKQIIEQVVQSSQQSTIQKLKEEQVPIFNKKKKELAKSYEALLLLLQ